MPTLELSHIAAALQPFAASFQADGYDLSLSDRDGSLVVTITAGPDACAECLIGKELMAGMITHELGGQGIALAAEKLVLVYPTERE
ncbi:MAG: hypothetical protein AB7R89_26085 [Dehalococcoidia bacterium]